MLCALKNPTPGDLPWEVAVVAARAFPPVGGPGILPLTEPRRGGLESPPGGAAVAPARGVPPTPLLSFLPRRQLVAALLKTPTWAVQQQTQGHWQRARSPTAQRTP